MSIGAVIAAIVNGVLMVLAMKYGGWTAWFCVLGGFVVGRIDGLTGNK